MLSEVFITEVREAVEDWVELSASDRRSKLCTRSGNWEICCEVRYESSPELESEFGDMGERVRL